MEPWKLFPQQPLRTFTLTEGLPSCGDILMISKTYTLYIEYSYIYVHTSIAKYQHIYIHTQNEWCVSTYDITAVRAQSL